ncbi:MAG: efflux RND transporter periplasmic adaptor subunit [Actinobacteria bacterium]|nr:efflux RND transporter periplasmic adaptor subunit [Actinomycetota bacterium]
MQKHLKILSLLLFLLMAIPLSGCAGQANAQSSVTFQPVTTITLGTSIESSGTLSAGQLTTLAWGTNGVIEMVNVKPGSQVKKGEVLASLRIDSVPASILQARADLASAEETLDSLQDNALVLTQAKLDVVTAEQTLADAEKTFASLDYPRASDALILNTEAQIRQAEQSVARASDHYRTVQNLSDGDSPKTEAMLALTNAQLSLNSLKANLNWYTGKPAQSDYDSARLNVEKAKIQLAEAQKEVERLQSGKPSTELAQAEASVAGAREQANAMYILAPFDGEVIVLYAQPGEVVQNSATAMGLVDYSTLKVELSIDESEITQVKVGDPAEISIDSLPGLMLTGKVTLIDPIGQTVSGLVKYTAIVSVERPETAILFGATANVIVTTGEPRALLAVPVGAILSDSDGEYILRVGADGLTQRVDVETGDLAGSLVTLVKSGGLKEGDQVQVGGSSGTNQDQQRNPGGMMPFGG